MTIISTRTIVASPRSQASTSTPTTPAEPWGISPWGDTFGRFVTSPWEGLRWEACPSPFPLSLAESEESGGLDNFLCSLMYGE
jgi:hypothetical protein